MKLIQNCIPYEMADFLKRVFICVHYMYYRKRNLREKYSCTCSRKIENYYIFRINEISLLSNHTVIGAHQRLMRELLCMYFDLILCRSVICMIQNKKGKYVKKCD